jgi:hypothetical protein
MFITILLLVRSVNWQGNTTALNVTCEVEKTILISNCNADSFTSFNVYGADCICIVQ